MAPANSCRFEFVEVDRLTLDLNNPRIARWIEMYGSSPTAEQIALALGAGSSETVEGGPSFASLKQSIRTHGGLIHPIVVNEESSGTLVVIEGNTRTQIFCEFREQGIAGMWDKIPAMIHHNLTDQEIDAIRLQAHLVGVRQWDPYSKAKYLNHLHSRDHLTLEQIVDFCGGDKREIDNYIKAFNDMEKFYSPLLETDQDFDPTRFSAFVELQSSRVTDSVINSGYTKTNFAKWVHDRKLHPLNTVRSLPRILQNKTARDAFLKYGAREALRTLETPTPEAVLADASLVQLAIEISKRINQMQYEDFKEYKKHPESEDLDIIRDTRDKLIEFCEDCSAQEI